MPVGDPLDEKTRVGAIVNEDQSQKTLGHVETGQGEGAGLVVGGNRPQTERRRRFAEPTAFDGVTPTMTIAREGVFGPVPSATPLDSPEGAVRIANGTTYGLSARVRIRDLDTAFHPGRKLEAWTVWVNTSVYGYPELPSGGYKESGLGRELDRRASGDRSGRRPLRERDRGNSGAVGRWRKGDRRTSRPCATPAGAR